MCTVFLLLDGKTHYQNPHRNRQQRVERSTSEPNELHSSPDFLRHPHHVQNHNNDRNFDFGFIPSITIHSSFQRSSIPSPSEAEVSSKSPEVHLEDSKESDSFEHEKENPIFGLKKENIISSFQKHNHNHIRSSDGSLQIELDDSEGDVTFETLMEVEEFEGDDL